MQIFSKQSGAQLGMDAFHFKEDGFSHCVFILYLSDLEGQLRDCIEMEGEVEIVVG